MRITASAVAAAHRFAGADPDGDGTVDAKEMESPAGAELAAMIQ